MTIEKLSDKKILISLCDEDMENFSLNAQEMGLCDEASRKSILNLLKLAIKETGMNAKSKTVVMEALPLKSGCLFLLTFTEKKESKKYRVKKSKKRPCYVFFDAEKLLCAAEKLYSEEIRMFSDHLWLYEGKYYVVFDYPLIKTMAQKVLGVYGRKSVLSELNVSRIEESGKLLCAENALYEMGRKLCGESI